ncbi:hypothetical protein GCM10010270_28220 [Streptomyces violaceus]|nr:hypothetical protein GCM10010270_28220 [Streptomyces janthinus]
MHARRAARRRGDARRRPGHTTDVLFLRSGPAAGGDQREGPAERDAPEEKGGSGKRDENASHDTASRDGTREWSGPIWRGWRDHIKRAVVEGDKVSRGGRASPPPFVATREGYVC